MAIKREALKDRKLKMCWIPSKPADERQEAEEATGRNTDNSSQRYCKKASVRMCIKTGLEEEKERERERF